jgi:hypothetical protein
MDNCKGSDINGPRRKWAVVGNPSIGGSDLLSEVVDEIRNRIYVSTHLTADASRKLTKEIQTFFPRFSPLTGGSIGTYWLDREPLIFKTEDDLMNHLKS